MLDEFNRYCALQRDQAPLAALLIYLKRKGGWVQLNQIWKELGPTAGGPFWNQTTLINKLDKLERLEVVSLERRVLPSSRSEVKKKTNTFCKLNPASPVFPHIYSMLKISKVEQDKYSSEMVDKPLERLSGLTTKSEKGDPMVERELEVALDLNYWRQLWGEARRLLAALGQAARPDALVGAEPGRAGPAGGRVGPGGQPAPAAGLAVTR